MRPVQPVFLVVSALLLLVALVPASPAAPRAFDPVPASVVFGGPDRFEGGTLVLGRYVPAPPSTRLVDLIPPERYAAFVAEEARRAAAPPKEEAVVEVWDTVPEEYDALDVRQHLPEGVRLAAAGLLQETGVAVLVQPLLAEELAAAPVPVLWVEGEVASAGERQAIDAARARGVAILASEGPEAVALVLREALRSSPHVLRLPADPLSVVSARRAGDLVHVRLASRPATADLEDVGGTSLGVVTLGSGGDLSFSCPDAGALPWSTRLVLSTAVEGVTLRRAYRVLDLVGASVLRVFSANVAEAGAPFAPRLLVHNLKTGDPEAGRRVAVSLERAGTVLASATVTSDAVGSADVRLLVPEDAEPGAAELRVDGQRYPIQVTPGLAVDVVTDRSLYRPTDEVHARVMVHRRSSGRPVPGAEVVLSLGDVEKRVRTSVHGIASATFRLDRAAVGGREVKALVGGAAAKARIRIRAFETPTFLLSVEPADLTLREGEEVQVVLRGRYVNGAPLVGAEVTADPGKYPGREVIRGRTDAEGTFRFPWRGLPGGHWGYLSLLVRDADGHEATLDRAWRDRRSQEERSLQIAPLEDVIAGLPARHVVWGPPGRTVNVRGGEAPLRTVTLDEAGRGEVSVTVAEGTAILRLEAEGSESREVAIPFASRASGRPVVIPARRTAQVGETLGLTIRGADGPTYLDVWRGPLMLRSLSTSVVDGVAAVALPLGEDLAGPLDFRAWRLEGEAGRGSLARVLVTRGRALRVTAAPERDAYRPAERAVVEVAVTDRDGRPTSAALGYWGVDEALLALAPWGPAREVVFDAVDPGHPQQLTLALDEEAGRPIHYHAVQSALGELAVDTDWSGYFPIRDRTDPKHQLAVAEAAAKRFDAAVQAAREAVAAAFDRMPLEELRTAHSVREILRRAVAGGWLDPEALEDPWGTPLRIDRDLGAWKVFHEPGPRLLSWSLCWGAPCSSPGPDLLPGTTDDLVRVWEPLAFAELGGRLQRFLELAEATLGPGELRLLDAPFLGPATNGLIGIGGGAGGTFAGRGGSRDLRTGGRGRARSETEALHVRRDFSPTLCFVPEVIVGPEGRARLEIPLRDAITTWRLRLVASAESGATGVGTTAIRVTQPLHLEPWVASHLTVGDEIDLPVAVRNETDAAFDVATVLAATGGLRVIGADREVVRVGPGGTQAVTFRLRATARGEARVRVDGAGGGHRDAVERVVHVHAAEREVLHAVSGTLGAGESWTAALPVLGAAAPSESRVAVYPSPMAETLAGFDGLIQCPHG